MLNVGEAQEIQPFLKELSQYTRPVEFRLGKNLPEADGNRLRNALAKYKRILVCVTEHRLTPYQNFFASSLLTYRWFICSLFLASRYCR